MWRGKEDRPSYIEGKKENRPSYVEGKKENRPSYVKINKIIIHKFSIALFPAERAQRAYVEGKRRQT